MSSDSNSAAAASASAASPAESTPSPAPAAAGEKGSTSTAETVHVLKTNKSTGIKSSYYHFSSTPAEEAARYAPQLISDPANPPSTSPQPLLLSTGIAGNITAPPASSTVAAAAPQAVGGSRWNAAGTWEDRDISSWGHNHLKQLLVGFEVAEVKGKITGFERVSGDCTIIFSRGRKKTGYDISALANFSAKVGDQAIKGSLEFPEIADSCADEPWQVLVTIKDQNADNKAAGEQVYDAFKKAVPDIRKKIDQWVEELKKQE